MCCRKLFVGAFVFPDAGERVWREGLSTARDGVGLARFDMERILVPVSTNVQP